MRSQNAEPDEGGQTAGSCALVQGNLLALLSLSSARALRRGSTFWGALTRQAVRPKGRSEVETGSAERWAQPGGEAGANRTMALTPMSDDWAVDSKQRPCGSHRS